MTYYPPQLLKILKDKAWVKGGGGMGFIDNAKGGTFSKDEYGIVLFPEYKEPDYAHENSRPLSADRVGDELRLFVGVCDNSITIDPYRIPETKFLRKVYIPMSSVLQGIYEVDTESWFFSTNLDKIISLYREAEFTVLEEVKRQAAEQAEKEHQHNVRDVQGAGGYPGVDGDFIEWCREHLKEIKVGYNNEDTRELLQQRFDKTDYEFYNAGAGRWSWEARIRFDEIEDCPNEQIIHDARQLGKDSVTVDRVDLAADLYDWGFDFGDNQPKYWKH